MSLAHVFKHILDGLWALGGIGAAADLGLEYSGLEDLGPDWDALCPVAAHCENIPLEGELCKIPCSNCSSRHSSR